MLLFHAAPVRAALLLLRWWVLPLLPSRRQSLSLIAFLKRSIVEISEYLARFTAPKIKELAPRYHPLPPAACVISCISRCSASSCRRRPLPPITPPRSPCCCSSCRRCCSGGGGGCGGGIVTTNCSAVGCCWCWAERASLLSSRDAVNRTARDPTRLQTAMHMTAATSACCPCRRKTDASGDSAAAPEKRACTTCSGAPARACRPARPASGE